MRSLAEIDEHALDGSPFSNGTEGEIWQANWCGRPCAHDAPFQRGETDLGCPLLLVALTGKTPAEWFEQPRDEHGRTSLADRYHCIEFRAEGDDGGREPQPIPDPPGQGILLPREDYQGVLMLTQPESSHREQVTA